MKLILFVMLLDSLNFQVSWDQNVEPDLWGYKVHYWNTQTSEIIDVGLLTSLNIRLINQQYTWAVTAYDTAGNESYFSDTVIMPDYTPTKKVNIRYQNSQSDVLTYFMSRNVVETDTGFELYGLGGRPCFIHYDFVGFRTFNFEAKVTGYGNCYIPREILINNVLTILDTSWQSFTVIPLDTLNISFLDDCKTATGDANVEIRNMSIQ